MIGLNKSGLIVLYNIELKMDVKNERGVLIHYHMHIDCSPEGGMQTCSSLLVPVDAILYSPIDAILTNCRCVVFWAGCVCRCRCYPDSLYRNVVAIACKAKRATGWAKLPRPAKRRHGINFSSVLVALNSSQGYSDTLDSHVHRS